jgi:hypothetical protein
MEVHVMHATIVYLLVELNSKPIVCVIDTTNVIFEVDSLIVILSVNHHKSDVWNNHW